MLLKFNWRMSIHFHVLFCFVFFSCYQMAFLLFDTCRLSFSVFKLSWTEDTFDVKVTFNKLADYFENWNEGNVGCVINLLFYNSTIHLLPKFSFHCLNSTDDSLFVNSLIEFEQNWRLQVCADCLQVEGYFDKNTGRNVYTCAVEPYLWERMKGLLLENIWSNKRDYKSCF